MNFFCSELVLHKTGMLLTLWATLSLAHQQEFDTINYFKEAVISTKRKTAFLETQFKIEIIE